MKKSLIVNARLVTYLLFCWLGGTTLLIGLVHTTDWWPFKVLLFISIVMLPGVALLRALRIELNNFSASILYSFGLGILTLMLSGLLVNQLLPLLGVQHPLETQWALGAWYLVNVFIIASGRTNKRPLLVKAWSTKNVSRPMWVLFILSLILPCLAVAGASRLNNGGDELFAMITLGFATSLIVYGFLLRRRLPDGLLAWLIFSIGLSVLLMTSLRGWDIVGHDVEREFRVYTLTHINALWNIGLYRDPYNACLSITILPEMFTRLLNVSGLLVFKVILQIIFAACPAVLYVLLRKHTPKLAALTGCLLFISYPTFINDSAMLTRQGVAYLFFALALLVISNRHQKKPYRLLFLLCSLGAILSHYSTAYMFVALFGVAVACKMIVTLWHTWRKRPLPREVRSTILSPLFACLLFAMTFIWFSQITGTSNGLTTTISKTLTNIPTIFSNDNKSSDISTALLFANNRLQSDLYQSYLLSTKSKNVASETNASQYIPTLTGDSLPLTPLGKKARAVGLEPSIITTLRQNFAKVLQLLALMGVTYATYRLLHKKPDVLGPDFTCLSLAGIILLSLLVVLPVLSINYGVLRAFQQTLIFLILPIMLLLVELGRRISVRVKTAISTTSMVLLFLLFTGVFAQLLGGVSPSLSMNNQGLYYGLYYSSKADAKSFAWLKEHIRKGEDVRAANFNRAAMHDPDYPFTRTGILPSQIGQKTYVYLDPAQVLTQKVYTYYDSSPFIVTLPVDYYDMAKNQIYSTTTTRIYR